MDRWGMPLLVVGVMFLAALALVLLPVKAEEEDCHASALGIMMGAKVPEELKEKCHEEASKEMVIGALPFTGGVVTGIASLALLRSAAREEGEAEEDDKES
jgi:hypothetical protein